MLPQTYKLNDNNNFIIKLFITGISSQDQIEMSSRQKRYFSGREFQLGEEEIREILFADEDIPVVEPDDIERLQNADQENDVNVIISTQENINDPEENSKIVNQ